jgi:cytochrome P450
LHNKYGPVVRISPGELAFLDPAAWRDIYGRRTDLPGGSDELPKFIKSYRVIPGLPVTIASAERDEHAILRKQLARGFSDRAMQEQEPIIGRYVDLLTMRLRENCVDGDGQPRALDMACWYNWTTFDIIGDLAFGEPFGCLENSAYDRWVKVINATVKQVAYLQAFNMIGLDFFVSLLAKLAIKGRERLQAMTRPKLLKRIEMGAERQDLIGGLLETQDKLVRPASFPGVKKNYTADKLRTSTSPRSRQMQGHSS